MRLERLTLKGFLRFHEPLTLDLTDVPPGLIAIVGDNGSGKTTLLEAPLAALYRSFVSRGDLTDYATDRDSFLEVQIATDGAGVFRARVNVDGAARKSDAVLEQLLPDGGRAILNDGKVSTFDTAVHAHFPDRGLLLASAFAAQNKAGSFITLDKKSRKQLFLQLLGLERYQTMSDTARQAAGLVDQSRARLVAQRELLSRDVTSEIGDGLAAQARRIEVDLAAAAAARVTTKSTIARLEQQLALVADQAAAYAAAQLAVQRIERELAARRHEAEILEAAEARTQIDERNELARLLAQRDADLAEIDELLTNNEKLRANATQVGQAVVNVRACDAELARLRSAEATARAEADQLDAEGTDLHRRDTAAQSVRFKLEAAAADAAILHTVPCAGQGAYATCPFLERATAAEALVPHLTTDLGDVEALHTAIRANLTQRQAIKTLLGTLAGKIRAVDDRLTADRAVAALAEKLAVVGARIEELTTRRTVLIARAIEAERDVVTRLAARVADQQRQRMAVDTRIDALVQERDEANDHLLGAAEGNRQAVAVQQQLAEARLAWDATTATIARLEAETRDVQRRQQEFSARRQTLGNLDATIAHLSADLVEWQTLTQAFGRDGLPVLEIDAAGPTISAYTNDLLASCYGPRFSVDVITQEAKAGGKGLKETFTIAVLDNAAGGASRDIVDLSGGEQVIVAEALANAIAIYVNTRAPQPVRTCWRDETTGALDPENAQRYLAMLRKVQALGGFHHVIFVSHNHDVSDLADAQIRLTDGHLTVARPPYAVAA